MIFYLKYIRVSFEICEIKRLLYIVKIIEQNNCQLLKDTGYF